MIKKSLSISIIAACSCIFAAYTNVLIDFNEIKTWDDMDPKNTNEAKFAKRAVATEWIAELNSSADFALSRKLTYVKSVDCDFNQVAQIHPDYAFKDGSKQGKVLGVRAHFPVSDYGAYVTVKPKWPFPYYAGDNGTAFLNKGMINNFGPMKSISAWVKGKSYPNTFFINLRDQDGQVDIYKMGDVSHYGWKVLTYKNQNYLANVRDREIENVPMYPRVEPLVVFDSMVFYKDGQKGYDGNFIAYVSWIEVEHDKAIIQEYDDIDDEGTWGINKERVDQRKAWEKDKYKRASELEDLERQKMNLPPKYDNPDMRETTGETGTE
ncbi:MAG TPA: flagellar filament outer layer protein FlaA [Spirochaetota bacterium]|nr:flagellar filament outer layer protein FlaA [Spirochaetota bacterium]